MNLDINFNQLRKNAKQVLKMVTEEGRSDIKIAILGDCATQHLATAIRGYGFHENLTIDVLDTDYNQILAQTMDDGSELYKHNPDAVVIDMCTEKLYEAYQETSVSERVDFADRQAEKIGMYWQSIKSHMDKGSGEKKSVRIIQMTFPESDDRTLGNYGNISSSSFILQLRKLNLKLSEMALSMGGIFLVDLGYIQLHMGYDRFKDSKLYYSAKLPYSMDALVLISCEIINIIKAVKGSIKKCVVLDLDNTLWGGVVGDDGLEGIQIGELGVGHAFWAFQCWLKELTKTGIILTVCSKNDDDKAREPFEKHPEMALRLDDIAMFTANWQDKASNIREQARVLNLGIDSFVFIDDNPFERDQVKSMIPEITVPDMPTDPALYVDYLQSLNLFERASISAEDAGRTKKYQEEAGRRQLENNFASYDEYLSALDMQGEANAFDSFNTPRIAQLSQRSNQFNLRTVRYTEADVKERAESEDYITIYFTLKDKFGDHGLISVLSVKVQETDGEKTGFIENWFMSCRVLKRGMEEFIINSIYEKALEKGVVKLTGEYIRTPKNNMVADIYERMGFVKTEDNDSDKTGGTARFVMDVNNFEKRNTHIKLVR